MSSSPERSFDPQPQGISLDELAEAFAQVMGTEPRRPAERAGGRERRSARRFDDDFGGSGGAGSRIGAARCGRRAILARSVRGRFLRRCCSWAIATTGRCRRPGRPN